jgi:hypothetical protein
MDLTRLTPAEAWRLCPSPDEDWQHYFLDFGAGQAKFTPGSQALTEPTYGEFLQTEAAAKFCLLARRVLDIQMRRIPEGWACRKSDKGFSVGGFIVPTSIVDAMNFDDFYKPDPFSAWDYSDRWYAEHIEAAPKS